MTTTPQTQAGKTIPLTFEEAGKHLYGEVDNGFRKGDRFLNGSRFALILGQTATGEYQVATLNLARTKTGDCNINVWNGDKLEGWDRLGQVSPRIEELRQQVADLTHQIKALKAQNERLIALNDSQSSQIKTLLKRLDKVETPTDTTPLVQSKVYNVASSNQLALYQEQVQKCLDNAWEMRPPLSLGAVLTGSRIQSDVLLTWIETKPIALELPILHKDAA